MYEEFFGLDRRPFALLSGASSIFWTEAHTRAYAALRDGLTRQSLITLVTGEVGAGKTTLIHHLLGDLPADYSVGLISSFINKDDSILQWVLSSFDQDFTDGSEPELLDRFHAFVVANYAAGKTTVLILDEAQNLSDDDLESFRLLTNANVDGNVLFLLVLVGQPELRERLMAHHYRQIMQRVGSQFHLRKMSSSETSEYIRHLLASAGATSEIFDQGALQRIYSATSGLPRKVNILCDLCMVSAFAVDMQRIDENFVEETLENLRVNGAFSGLINEADVLPNQQIEPDTELSAAQNPIPPEVEVSDERIPEEPEATFPTEDLSELPEKEDPIESLLKAVGHRKPVHMEMSEAVEPSSVPPPVVPKVDQPSDIQDDVAINDGIQDDTEPPAPKQRKRSFAIVAVLIGFTALGSLAFVDNFPTVQNELSRKVKDGPAALQDVANTSAPLTAELSNQSSRTEAASIVKTNSPPSPNTPKSAAEARPSAVVAGSPPMPEIELVYSNRQDTPTLPSDEPNLSLANNEMSIASVSGFVPSGREEAFFTSASVGPIQVKKHSAPKHVRPLSVNITLDERDQLPFQNENINLADLRPVSAASQAPVFVLPPYQVGKSQQLHAVPHTAPLRGVAKFSFTGLLDSEQLPPDLAYSISAPTGKPKSSSAPSLSALAHQFNPVNIPIRLLDQRSILSLLNMDRDSPQDDLRASRTSLEAAVSSDGGASYFNEALDNATGDPTSIATLYARAALRGHARAAYYLGQLYETGDGVTPDLALAKAWYAFAAEGNSRAKDRSTRIVVGAQADISPGTPELRLSEVLPSGLGEFVWTSGTGAKVGDYLVQIAGAQGQKLHLTRHIKKSAAILPLPSGGTHWRVVTVDLQNKRYAPSDWQPISAHADQSSDQPSAELPNQVTPFVTIVSTDPQHGLSTALKDVSISSRVIAPPAALSDPNVYYFYEQDRETAIAVASTIFGRGEEDVVSLQPSTNDLIAWPGDILVILGDTSSDGGEAGSALEQR